MIELSIGSEVIIDRKIYVIEHFGRLSDRIAIAASRKKTIESSDPIVVSQKLSEMRTAVMKYYNDRKKVMEENGFSTISIVRGLKHIDDDVCTLTDVLLGDYSMEEVREAFDYVIKSGRNLKHGEFSWFHYMSRASNLAKVSQAKKMYIASILESVQKDKSLGVKKVDKKYTQNEDNDLGL